MYAYKKQSGFSLVELSIVLIIIGLLVAGVTGGSKLIEQTKLNKVIRDLNNYKTAFHTFRLTYDAYPGDLQDAYDYWGSSCDSDANKCNGNNNGLIDRNTESFRAWQHLGLSNISHCVAIWN